MKRVVLALAAFVAALLAVGPGTAFASCDAFTLDASGARANDVVGYHVANCVTNDRFEWNVVYDDGVDEQGKPKTATRSLHEDGVASADGTYDGTFRMIDLGSDQKDVKIQLTVNGTATYDLPPGTTFSYLGPALGSTGPTGNTGPAGSTGPVLAVPPLAAQQPLTSDPQPKKAKKKSAKKKSTSKAKSHSKSKSQKHSGSSNPTSTPTTPAPTTPTYTPPATGAAPVTPTITPQNDVKPPTTPQPPTIPPGIQGPGGTEPTAPTPPVPTPPATAVPVAPVAAAGGGDSNGMAVPVWLVILLGLVALLGLGGAQARLLGLWGPLVPLNGRDTGDARLLALQRVSQSGASFQKRIAELKKAARERAPVG